MKTFEVKINCSHFKGTLSVVAMSYDEAEETALELIDDLRGAK